MVYLYVLSSTKIKAYSKPVYFMKIPSLSMCTYFIIITLCDLNPFGLWDVYCSSKNGDDSEIFFSVLNTTSMISHISTR